VADLLANPARIPGIQRRSRTLTSRTWRTYFHAHRGSPHQQNGSPTVARLRLRTRSHNHVSTLATQPQRRILGHLLASGAAGSCAELLIHSPDGAINGRNSKRKDGKRHQHLQPDAQYRWQRWHRPDDHIPGTARTISPEPPDRESYSWKSPNPKLAERAHSLF